MTTQEKKKDLVKHVGEQFAKAVVDHEVRVIRSEGLYRHVRFRSPKTWAYGFDLVTWPGYLAITGDLGCLVFSRIPDMFHFFRGNFSPDYWAGKLEAPKHDAAYSYSEDCLAQAVEQHAKDFEEWGEHDRAKRLRDAYAEAKTWRELHAEEGAREWLREIEGDIVHETWEWNLRDYDHQYLFRVHAIHWGVRKFYETHVSLTHPGRAG